MNKPMTIQEKVNQWRGISNASNKPSVSTPATTTTDAAGDKGQSSPNTTPSGPSTVGKSSNDTKGAKPSSKESGKNK